MGIGEDNGRCLDETNVECADYDLPPVCVPYGVHLERDGAPDEPFETGRGHRDPSVPPVALEIHGVKDVTLVQCGMAAEAVLGRYSLASFHPTFCHELFVSRDTKAIMLAVFHQREGADGLWEECHNEIGRSFDVGDLFRIIQVVCVDTGLSHVLERRARWGKIMVFAVVVSDGSRILERYGPG